ncbi:MAG: trigger factor [Fimbriimonadaceae bacterium]|nr:trigger factor [Fimbriimonadaceae bacterium]
MQITREDLNPATVQLHIVVPEAMVLEGYAKAYKDAAKDLKIPGFRPGTAPRSVVEKAVSPEFIQDRATDIVMNRAYREALKRENLTPYSQPGVSDVTIAQDPPKGEFTIKVPLAPVVKLTEYTGIKAIQPTSAVSDADVQNQIEVLRKREAKREQITDRKVIEGDVAVVNIKIEGQEGDGRNFMSVVGKTFPSLDEALIGMAAEEVKVVELTFPETFDEKDWANQTHRCRLTLRSVSAMKLPDLDDDFAQSLGFGNEEELTGRVRALLEEARVSMVHEYVSEQIMGEIVKASEIHVPLTMVEAVAGQQLRDLAQAQAEKKSSLAEYAQEKGMTLEELQKAIMDESRVQVERAVVAQEIFKKEGMKLNNEDFNRELFDMAREYRVTPDEMVALLKKNNALDELRNRALYRKVTDFLIKEADLQELPDEATA